MKFGSPRSRIKIGTPGPEATKISVSKIQKLFLLFTEGADVTVSFIRLKPGLHLLSFAENRRERIFGANIDEKPLIWFTFASICQENVKKM